MEEISNDDQVVEEEYKPGDEITLVILTEEDLQRGETYGESIEGDL